MNLSGPEYAAMLHDAMLEQHEENKHIDTKDILGQTIMDLVLRVSAIEDCLSQAGIVSQMELANRRDYLMAIVDQVSAKVRDMDERGK